MDPELAKRGIKGLANSSEADRRIWAEFYGKWGLLASQIKVVVSTQVAVGVSPGSGMLGMSAVSPERPTEVVMTVKQRRGQRFFRAAVLAGHDGKCCITGIAHPEMLRAGEEKAQRRERSAFSSQLSARRKAKRERTRSCGGGGGSRRGKDNGRFEI